MEALALFQSNSSCWALITGFVDICLGLYGYHTLCLTLFVFSSSTDIRMRTGH